MDWAKDADRNDQSRSHGQAIRDGNRGEKEGLWSAWVEERFDLRRLLKMTVASISRLVGIRRQGSAKICRMERV